jgi:Flp pilus assembly protein CpaB
MTAPVVRRPRLLRRLRRLVLARRRLLAAACAGLAVATALQANAAPPEPRTPVLTAARDLPPGTVLAATDLVPVDFAPESVPVGVVARGEAVGRVTVGPVRAGEPLTDARLLGGSLLAAYPAAVAAPVRIGDAASVDLLRVGDRVSILAADPQADVPAVTVAEDVPVIGIPARRRTDPSLGSGALVLVAVDAATARALAGASAHMLVSVVLLR